MVSVKGTLQYDEYFSFCGLIFAKGKKNKIHQHLQNNEEEKKQ